MLTDSEITNLHRRPSEKRLFARLRKTLVGLFIAAACLYGLSFLAIRPLAQRQMERLTGGAVYIQSARLSGLASVKVKGLIVAADEQSLMSSPILRADKVEIAFNPRALLKGHMSVTEIQLTDFLVSADNGKSGWNWMALSPPAPLSEDSAFTVPLIGLNRGAVRVRRQTGQGFSDALKFGFNGQMVMQADRKQYSFTVESDGRFGLGGTSLLGQFAVDGPTSQMQLSLAGTIRMPEASILGNSWNLNNLSLDCAYDRQSVEISRLAFDLGEGQADIKGRFEPASLQMNLDVQAKNMRISDRRAPDTLVYSPSVRSFLDPGLRDFLERFRPRGTGDANLSFAGRLNDLSSAQIEGSLYSRDVAVTDSKFAYRVEHITGEVILAGRQIRLNHLQAKHNDAFFTIDGSIENPGLASTIDFRLKSDAMPLDEDLFRACGPATKKVWYSFAPTGTIGLDYHYKRAAGGKPDLTIALQLQSVTAVYQHFPYPLDNLEGTVLIKPDAITFDRLVSSSAGGKTISLSGKIEELESDAPVFQVSIRGQNVPLNRNLINAMPRRQRAYFDLVEIDACADVEMTVRQGKLTQALPEFSAKISLAGDRLLVKQFPLQMTDIKLSADVTADRIELHRFEAAAGSGKVSFSGQLYQSGENPASTAVCLDLDFDRVAFEDDFWDAAAAETLSLGSLRVSGPVTIKGHYEKNLPADACRETWLTLDCHGNPLTRDGRELGLANGTVRFSGNRFTFDKFQLNIPQVESLPAEIFSRPILSAYRWAKPSGSACVVISDGFVQTDGQKVTQADLTGEAFLYEVTCGQGRQVENLSGHFTGRFSGGCDGERWNVDVLTADYDIKNLTYEQCQFNDVFGTLAYDPDTQVCLSKDFAGTLYGGNLGGSWTIDLRNERKYRFSAAVTEMDISRMFAAKGPLQEGAARGLANAELKLEGSVEENALPEGRLAVKVSDLRIGTQSFLGKVLTAIQLKEPREYIFSGIELDAAVRGKTLVCQRVRIAGRPLIFYGSGTLNLDSEQVDLELVGIDRLFGDEDTIISMLARGVGSAIWRVQVKGDYNDPSVETVYFSVLKQPLELFKRKEPI